ncbi:ATP-binding protein [Lederbergia citrea]|uniref:ATP-binding protein n=1 Tax=Lederbergia citrea TaxID=2833581 RepID=UPI001BC8E914|nr:ATP-binding protein [Lederbergia citrea]MBS4204488.1 histidine kinase [Lederbergia citrea]
MILRRNIKPFAKKLIIYLLITLLPTIVICTILTKQQMKEITYEYKNEAQWNANLHAKSIENFIGETVGRLEMLTTLINIQHNNLDHVEEILRETHAMDKRFSGFYWANPEGDLLFGSNSLSSVNVSDRDYFQKALKTGKTSFSNAHIGRVTGRFIITIANPVSDNGDVKGVLLASLRLDELGASMKDLLNDEMIIVTDHTGETIIETVFLAAGDHSIDFSVDLIPLPWTITAKVIPDEDDLYGKTIFYNFFIVFFIMNILLLFIHFIRLKYKVKKEKEQNEYQKLELIGNLAASTAHEIRNPLTGIKGLISLLSEEYKDKKAQYYFEVIQMEITRITTIVNELLLLGRPTAYTLHTNNVKDILKEIEPIIQSEAHYMNVDVSMEYPLYDLPISCVKDQIKQVFLNLSKNALHAMPNGGKLTISLQKHADSCIIQVVDNGKGIPKEILDQVFNPFFTMDKDGSGLGLTVCKRIIDSYSGTISIQSTLHKGTQVEIRVPLSKEV